MKKQFYLTTLLLLILFISNCDKCPDSGSGNTHNVYPPDIPIIFPYNDTSRVRFLKNGTDTIIFISQGLKSTYIKNGVANGNCAGTDRLQQISLKMEKDGNESFEIIETSNSDNEILINVNNLFFGYYSSGQLASFYPLPLKSYLINSVKYDSVKILTKVGSNDTIIFKPKIGVLKIKSNNTYEKIK
ncbi:MAG: hypothetical protein NTU43_11235 [Bacteroidetes bacterium]|nr:hypothetical protein [Bacteroidota bacterium]